MVRQWLFLGVGTVALAAILQAGCGHTQHSSQGPPAVCTVCPPGCSNVVIQNRAAAQSPTYFPTQAPAMGALGQFPIAGPGEPAYASALPEIVTVPRDRMPDPVSKTTSAKPVEEQSSGVLRLDDSQTITLKHDPQAPRRSFADITAKPGYAHAPDYSWIAGELQFLHSRKVWRLRYASVDEEDRYGGGMTLIEAGPMTEFKEGQMVRVEGQVADVTSHESEYRVKHIKPLGGL